MELNQQSISISGTENIPPNGHYLVTLNHYCRPGFQVWWLVMAIASCLPVGARFIITGELTRWKGAAGGRLSRFGLPRLAKVYGFTSMPPMPPRPQDVEARARSVREVLKYIDSAANPVLVLSPEGRDNLDGGSLASPPPGAGRFMSMIAKKGLMILPVGGWEENGRLCIHFGQAYILPQADQGLSSTEKDSLYAGQVMHHIAQLLPPKLRGVFSDWQMEAS